MGVDRTHLSFALKPQRHRSRPHPVDTARHRPLCLSNKETPFRARAVVNAQTQGSSALGPALTLTFEVTQE